MKIAAPFVMLVACGQTRAGVPSVLVMMDRKPIASTSSNGPVRIQDCSKLTSCVSDADCCMGQQCLEFLCAESLRFKWGDGVLFG